MVGSPVVVTLEVDFLGVVEFHARKFERRFVNTLDKELVKLNAHKDKNWEKAAEAPAL